MNELLARLVNLSYEFFGVILPGIITSVCLGIIWVALGPLAPLWTQRAVPELSISRIQTLINSLSTADTIASIGILLVAWYLVGQILLWTSRFAVPIDNAEKRWGQRVWLTLRFRIPRPTHSFKASLQPIYDEVSAKFADRARPLDWEQFYPIVKSFLAQRLRYSLVTTYQNKYTLHRSIATAAAVSFWISMFGMVGAFLTPEKYGCGPMWILLSLMLALSLLCVSAFSHTYIYHWKMFGDTIITEAYSLIYGPKAP
jgi:hypothetical protein